MEKAPSSSAGAFDPRFMVAVASAISFIAALAYNWSCGLIVFMGDSYLLANRAKHFAQQFNLNLDNGLAPLIYPPLYPILVSPAYLFASPDTIFLGILAIHALLVAMQVPPYYLLLRHYGELRDRQAAVLALALSFAPATLPYGTLMLTEVAFLPVLLWVVYLFDSGIRRKQWAALPLAGAALAAAMLVRTAATSFVVGYAAAGLWALWSSRRDEPERRRLLRGLFASAVAFLFVYGGWTAFERLFVKYEGFHPYFQISDVAKIFQNAARFDLHFSWFANCILYLLMAPLSVAGIYVLALFARHPRRMLADPNVLFWLIAAVLSSWTVAFVMADHWGGPELTWNKYVMPCVPLLMLAGVRHRRYFNRSYLCVCSLMLLIAFLAFRPAVLGCHFTDALAFFNKNAVWGPPAALTNALYLAGVLGPAWLWLSGETRRRRAAVAITGAVWAISHIFAWSLYRNSGDLNVSRYEGAAKLAWREVLAKPETQAYYDPYFGSPDSFGALRILFYWPDLNIRPKPIDRLLDPNAPAPTRTVYFTNSSLMDLSPVAQDRGQVKLFVLSGKEIAERTKEAAPLSGARVTLPGGFPGAEVGVYSGQRYTVRWLASANEFLVHANRAIGKADIRLQVGTYGGPRRMSLSVNGERLPQIFQVSKVFWERGADTAVFRVKLRQGENRVSILSLDPPAMLPGNRPATFLLVGDIQIRAPSPAPKRDEPGRK